MSALDWIGIALAGWLVLAVAVVAFFGWYVTRHPAQPPK